MRSKVKYFTWLFCLKEEFLKNKQKYLLFLVAGKWSENECIFSSWDVSGLMTIKSLQFSFFYLHHFGVWTIWQNIQPDLKTWLYYFVLFL